MKKYKKFLVALGAACASAGVALQDGDLSSTEAITIALAFAGALGVYGVTNAPGDDTGN